MARTARNVRRLLAAAALAAAAAGALLLARSGEAATPLTLTTITIDGNLGDWDAVLANPLQTTRDGDGQSWDTVGECALYSTDRDCPVLGGIGNDLYTFAWTYDASYVYLFIERYTGTTTGVDFFFVADTDQDKLVESAGDVVIRANWKGQSGDVAVTSGPYVPVNTLAGDPIATVEGYVDGYKLPGNNGTLVDVGCGSATGLGVTSGADDGRKAEIRVPWCAFGVAPLQPFLWHVASSNTVALSGAVDNIGAPSGKLGTFVQRAVSFFPDRAGAVLSPGSVEYTHTLVNDGNEPDVFDFVATSSQGARVELVSGGTVIGRDDQGDGTWELPAAARPQVLLAVGASQALQIRITMPSGRTGQDVTRVTARSVKGADEGLTVTATVTDSSHVGSPAFVPEVLSAWTQPGVSVAFAETLVNGQLDADTFDLLADGGCAGHELRLTTDSAGANLAARDDTGDGSWDFVDPAHDTVPVNGAPDLGPIAGQSYKTFWLWVTPPAGAPYGACAVRLTALSPTTGATAHADHTVTVAPAVAFAPSYTRAAGTSKRVGVNDAVTFAAVIRNSESVPRAYALSQVVTPSASGASARVWSDPNGDGSPADGLLITTTGTVAPFGGAYPVVVELLAGSAPSGTALSVATTATATAGGASATQTSEADVGYLATYADALLNDATSVFAPCSTVYLHATGLALSNTTNYTLRWLDPASNVMRTLAPWPTTARGIADDAWALAAGAALGDWRTQLVDGPGTRDQELTFTVELIGDVSALATDRARYRPGDAVQVTGSFRDGGRTALAGSSLGYTLDGAPLRTRTGVTVPAGATVQDPFSFVLPADAAPGLRTLVAGWTLSCGATPFATRPATFEVQPLAPAITSPAPGARLKTHTPVIQGTAVAGASVTVTIGGSSYAPVTAAGDGTWSFTAPSLPDGSYTASAVQAVAGVPSDPSAPVTFTLDTTAPGAPVVQAIASPTNAAPVPVPVTAEAGSTVALFVGGAPATATLVSADAGTFTFDVTLAEGTWSIQATAADDLGNTSALSAARSVVVDRTPPAPPVLAGYPLPVNDDPVAVLATAAAGSTVRLSVDGAFVKEMAEGPAGTFTATLDLPVDDSYGLTATAADPVGNVSGPSASVTLVVDRTAPDAPVIAPVGSPTNADPVVVTVTAEEGANVSLELDGAPSGVAPGVSGTTYTFPLLGVASGEHAVVAVATDSAGNPSLPSEPLLFDVDRIPPAVPAVQPIASPTKLQPVPVTVAIDPADVGATVQLRVDGAASAATPVSVSGTSYAFELTLTEGPHTVAATAADALGNVSALSAAQSVTVDRTAPATPVVTPALPAAANGDLLLVAGTAEVGATVTVTVTGSGLAPVPAPAVATGGTFSVYVDFTTFPDDVYAVRVQATDAAGNPSVLSAPVSVRVDRVAPGAPTVSVPATSADPVVVSVTAEAGTTVVLVLDGTPRPDVLPASVVGNAYEFELPVFGGGTHDVSAVATDAAGNASAASNLAIFVVDNLLPSAPVVTVTSPTNEGPPVTVVVSADPGDGVASVNLYVDGVDSGVTPSVSGSTFTFLLPLAEGSYVLDATATDAASLVSPPSAARVLVVDRSPPPMPTGFTVPDATSALSLPLAGMAEPGSTIWFEVGYMPILSTVAAADGTWSADVPLPAGSVRLNVGFNYWATDAAGNLDGKYLGGLVVDREPPAAPTVAPIAPSPTKAANVTVAVTVAQAETGLTVQLFDDGVEVTATPTVSGTTWTFVLDPGEGSTDFTATATDALGNVSDLSAPASVTVDRTAPAVPSIAPIAPSPTNAADVTVVVTVAEAEAGLAVRLLDGGVEVTATPSIVGTTWTFVLDPGEGTHAFTATAADVLGNVSALSAPVSVEVDRTAPAVPSIAPVTTPTRATTVTAVVTATAGATVQLRVDGTDVAAVDPGYAVDFAGATWTFTFDPGEGLFDLTATASDALGNTSAPSVAMTVAVDRTPPAVPAIAPIASPTRAESVTVVVSVAPADAGATVRLFLDGLQASVSPVVSGTDYTFVLDPGEGTHAFTATAADALGNGSAPSAPITVEVDRTPPGAPSIAPILPNPTNAATVTVAVTADAGATVVLFADGTPSAVVPTVSGGVHTFALDPGEGSTAFTATAADALGNVSALSPAQSVGVDRTPPNVPSIAPLATPTNAAQVAVTVTADAGSTVKLWVNGVQTSLVPTVAGVTYGFTWAPPADGSYSLQATAADALGNTSARSTARTVVVDRTAPSATPTVAGLPAVTAAASVAVTGTADAGTTVTVAVAGMAPVTAVVAGDGTWSADVPLPAADGDAAVTVTAADAAGNLSPAFSGSVTVDRTAPAAPVVTAPVAGASLPPGTVTVSGTAEPGATVTVTVDGTAQAVTADGTGAFQLDASLTDGNHFISVTAADAAGNVSAQADVAFVVQTPASDDGGGGGCGCGPGGAGPEALLLVTLGLVLFRRRRAVR